MKKKFLWAIFFCFLFVCMSNGWARPYKSKEFPSKDVFEEYKRKTFFSIGKWKNRYEDIYSAYGFYRLDNGEIGYEFLGMFVKLDNDYWIIRNSESEPWQLFDPEK